MKAKVIAHPARGAITVEAEKLGQFNAVTAFDCDPPKIGDEIEVTIKSKGTRIVDNKAVEIVEHAVHVRK